MATEIWVNIGSDNHYLNQWSPVTFILGQFHKRCLNHQSLFENYMSKISFKFPRGHWFNGLGLNRHRAVTWCNDERIYASPGLDSIIWNTTDPIALKLQPALWLGNVPPQMLLAETCNWLNAKLYFSKDTGAETRGLNQYKDAILPI